MESEGAVAQPEVEIEAQRRTLERLEGVQVERNRMTDDLLKELLAQFDLALPQRALVGPLRVPPERGAIGHRRTHAGFSVLVFVDQPDMGVKEPPHLVAEPGVLSAAAAVDPQGSHEVGERIPHRTKTRLWVVVASVEIQAMSRRGRLP